MTFLFNASPVEVYLQGDGALTNGSIAVTCTGENGLDSVSNMSLIAYVGSGIN